MPITVGHAKVVTVPDSTDTGIVRPSDWNSSHAVTFSISGSEAIGAFNNAGGVTFGLETNGSITAAAPAGAPSPVNFSAGTASANLASVVFSNSNGVSFGLNGATITASHNALTTAALSNHSHGNPTLALTNLSGTTASNSAGLTLSLSAGNYLTTARASNDAVGLNTALTGNGVAWTVNSSGLSLNVPAFLTTAALSNHSHGNPTLALTNLSGTTASASNGFTLSLSAGAGGAGDGVNILAAGTQTANTTGTVLFNNGGGVTFGMSNNSVITATVATNYQSQGAYLTTARASNDAVGLNTALTGNGVAWTVNSSGISLNVPAFLTTAALSNHSHGNPTLALTNLSGTTASNSAGLTLSLSAAAPGAGGGIAAAAGTQTATSGTVLFNNSNGITFGMSNSSVITASHNGLTTAAQSNHSHGNPTLALTNLSGTTASASNGLTLSLSAAAPGAAAAVPQRWHQIDMFRFSLTNLTNITAISNVPFLQPFRVVGDLTISRLNYEMSRSTSGSNLFSVTAMIYSYVNDTQISSIASATAVYSNTATASVSGIRRFAINGFNNSTFPPGGYVLGMMFNAGANTASMNYAIRGFSGSVQLGAILPGTNSYNTAATNNIFPFFGRFSTTTGALPATIGDSQVLGQFSGASAPINAWIGFNND